MYTPFGVHEVYKQKQASELKEPFENPRMSPWKRKGGSNVH